MAVKIQVPPRLFTDAKVGISFAGGIKTFPDDIKKAIRNVAKQHQNYFLGVDNGGVNGRTNDGSPIPINNLGKWLFGTPGYMGHIRLNFQSANNMVYIQYPSRAPQEAIDMLESLTAEQIIAQCGWWGNEEYSSSWPNW